MRAQGQSRLKTVFPSAQYIKYLYFRRQRAARLFFCGPSHFRLPAAQKGIGGQLPFEAGGQGGMSLGAQLLSAHETGLQGSIARLHGQSEADVVNGVFMGGVNQCARRQSGEFLQGLVKRLGAALKAAATACAKDRIATE